MSYDLTLILDVDGAKRGSVAVTVGADGSWARATLSGSPDFLEGEGDEFEEPTRIDTMLRQARNMLTAAGISRASGRQAVAWRFSIQGPDAVPDRYKGVLEAWQRQILYPATVAAAAPAISLSAAQEIPMAPRNESPTFAGLVLPGVPPARQIAFGRATADGPTSRLRALWGPGEAPPQRGASESDDVVRSLAATVMAHVRTHGAAPDFRSDKKAEAAHNHIRSVTGQQNMTTEVAEAVRRILAGLS